MEYLLTRRSLSAPRKQRGAMLPIIALGLVIILGIAGMAIDSSHLFLNGTRLQNALDAAALSAAKTLNQSGGNTDLATLHGTEAFDMHLVGELDSVEVTLEFDFAKTLKPFESTDLDTRFVRVSVADYEQQFWFAQVLPGVEESTLLGATAVAGPIPLGSGKVCDIAPMIVCGDPSDTDSSDGTYLGMNFGDEANVQCIKSSRNNFGADDSSRMARRAKGGNGNGNNGNGNGNGGSSTSGTTNQGNNGNGNSDIPPECQPPVESIGPGNFQLAQLSCGSGANCVRISLASDLGDCAEINGSISTKPGNAVGPTAQGLNTRFGIYQGPTNATDHPPDLVSQYPLTYTQYQAAYFNEQFDQPNGSSKRRVLAVPIGNCSVASSGVTSIPILGFGCYFLTQPTQGTGQNNWIIGHLIEGCEVGGSPGETPVKTGNGYSTYKIILYNDPDNLAS